MANSMNLCLTVGLFLAFLEAGESDSFNGSRFLEREKNISECGGIFTGKKFFLQSPNYPDNYGPNLTCEYFLRGPDCPTNYRFDFIDFRLESSVGCTKDRLEIEDQDALCDQKKSFKMYFVKNGSLKLKLKTDADGSEKGFRIMVTRTDCEPEVRGDVSMTTTESVDVSTTQLDPDSSTLPFVSYNLPNFVPELPQCCSNTYNSKRFLLTSPNFPYSLNQRTKCRISIEKANENVCRVRLDFHFFWLGTTNYNNCPFGYLEIDGKYICGCNKELKLTTTFGTGRLKTLTFESKGVNLNFPSGFVLEVIQDECPKKYYPQSFTDRKNNSQLSRYSNYEESEAPLVEQEATIEQLQLVNELTDIVEDAGNSYYRNYPRIIKSVYLFAAPDYYPIPSSPQDIERTTFIDTKSINSIVTNFEHIQCNNWNQIQFNTLNERYGRNFQTCRRTDMNEISSKNDKGQINCVELDYLVGFFKSPGYPFYYPGGLNMCYRFRKQPGYCAARVFMVDFQVEKSMNCRKDYLFQGNGNRYCGNNLFGQSLTFDLTNKDHEDIRFVTDSFHCGRGFSGVYQQIACRQPDHPINPVKPTTPVIPTVPIPTKSPFCDRIVVQKEFVLEVPGNMNNCIFQIKKYSEDVCKINLYFERFDLVCAAESLIVDGMIFCGQLSGRKVSINVEGDEIKQLVYRSSLDNRYGDLRLRIIGEQITNDCLDPEVPPERLVQLEPYLLKNPSRPSDTTRDENISKYFVAMRNQHLQNICGVITKSETLPENFCEILKRFHNATRCTILDNNYSYEPNQINKLNLIVDKPDREIEYEEVDCDNTQMSPIVELKESLE